MKNTGMNNISALNASLLRFIDKFPRAIAENIDFYYKSEYDNIIEALKTHDEKSIALFASSEVEMDQYLRRFLLISDLVVFNIGNYSNEPKPMLLPISDDVASPILGVVTVTDPETMKPQFPTPVEIYYMMAMHHGLGVAGDSRSDFLGFEWGRQGYEWRRTSYTRTSQTYQNDVHEACHIAVGAGLPYPSTTYEWLMQQARPLLESGNIVFAPFLRAAPDSWGGPESIHKSHYLHSDVGTTSLHFKTDIRLRSLLELDLPYLDGIPLSLYAEILKDEKESFIAFRSALITLVKKLEGIKDNDKYMEEIDYIRKNHIEAELSKLHGLIKRVSNMCALRTAGCVVGSSVICLLSAMGIPTISLLLPAAGGIVANLMELAKRIDEEQKMRDNPMYFLWHLKSKRVT